MQIGGSALVHLWRDADELINRHCDVARQQAEFREPSFEKCIARESIAERKACFDTLRKEFLKTSTR